MDQTKDTSSNLISAVSDLRDVPLQTLASGPSAQSEQTLDRVLALEEGGLLTVATFNSAI